ncbi:MAG: DUF2752 domain-containing protein [Acutalibacteraceae bacterium]
MFKSTVKIIVKHIFYILLLLLIGASLYFFKIPCFFRFFTKIPCPSCGMTRAFLSLMKLNFYESFYYHPLLIPSLIVAFIAIHMNVSALKFNKKICNVCLWIFIIIFFVVYIFRLMTNSIP